MVDSDLALLGKGLRQLLKLRRGLAFGLTKQAAQSQSGKRDYDYHSIFVYFCVKLLDFRAPDMKTPYQILSRQL